MKFFYELLLVRCISSLDLNR